MWAREGGLGARLLARRAATLRTAGLVQRRREQTNHGPVAQRTVSEPEARDANEHGPDEDEDAMKARLRLQRGPERDRDDQERERPREVARDAADRRVLGGDGALVVLARVEQVADHPEVRAQHRDREAREHLGPGLVMPDEAGRAERDARAEDDGQHGREHHEQRRIRDPADRGIRPEPSPLLPHAPAI